MQDIATPGSAKPFALSGGDRTRVLLLGANVWVIGVLWPLFWTRSTGALELTLAVFGPAPLLLGAIGGIAPALRGGATSGIAPALRGGATSGIAPALRGGATSFEREFAPRWRAASWLVAFPAALAFTWTARPELVNQQLYGSVGLCVLGLALCGYGAAAAGACAGRAQELASTHHELGNDSRDALAPARPRLQQSVIALCFVGAAALCLVAPHIGDVAALETAWGPAAASGSVLCAVVGAALGVALLAIYLGNILRALPANEPRSDRGLRTAWYLFLAALSLITYFVVG